MLFDIEDYCPRYIGPGTYPAWEVFEPFNTTCTPPYGWDYADLTTLFRANSDAFIAILRRYIGNDGAVLGDIDYGVTNLPCNNAVCSPGPIIDTGLDEPNRFTPAVFNNFYNLYYDHRAKVDALFTHLEDVATNPTTVVFNQAFYDDMITAFNLMVCGFKDLMKILDDDDFVNYF